MICHLGEISIFCKSWKRSVFFFFLNLEISVVQVEWNTKEVLAKEKKAKILENPCCHGTPPKVGNSVISQWRAEHFTTDNNVAFQCKKKIWLCNDLKTLTSSLIHCWLYWEGMSKTESAKVNIAHPSWSEFSYDNSCFIIIYHKCIDKIIKKT